MTTPEVSVILPQAGTNFTDQSNTTVAQSSAGEADRNFYVGLFLAILSTIFIGSSFIFKKRGLLKLAKHHGTRAGDIFSFQQFEGRLKPTINISFCRSCIFLQKMCSKGLGLKVSVTNSSAITYILLFVIL